MGNYFGTDGIRGVANRFPVDAQTLLLLGQAAGKVFRRGDHQHRAIIGKDTRLSGYMIESALTSGLTSMGVEVLLCGPLPTPAVAFLTKSMRADLGIMISASHNGFADNGIKFFGPDGCKLSDALQKEIERSMKKAAQPVPPQDIGRARRVEDARARYLEFAKRSFPKALNMDNMRIVLDCAHGAAYKTAPTALWELGADVITMGNKPDGLNINQGCGSTEPEAMQEAVRQHGADIGIALDGDADRIIIADEKGELIDGDHILAFLASIWKEREMLSKPGIVATILSNLGLERYLQSLDLSLARTPVGDRYVAQHMRQHGFNLGGEKSGHLLMSDFSTTGDGLISGLQFLAALCLTNRPASAARETFTPAPQIQRNVPKSKSFSMRQEKFQRIIKDAQKRLGKDGRLIVRPSGTEPVLRIMGESDNTDLLHHVVGDVADALERSAL